MTDDATTDITLSVTSDINLIAFQRTESSLNISGLDDGYKGSDLKDDSKPAKATQAKGTTDESSSSGSSVDDSNYFTYLSDELVQHVFGFLDPLSFTKVRMVDKRFYDLSDSVAVWRKVAYGSSWTPGSTAKTAQVYRDKYKKFYTDQKIAEQRRLQQQKLDALKRRKKKLGRVLLATLFNKIGEYLAFLSLVVFTALFALKMDNSLDASWPVVTIPLLISGAVIFILPTMLCSFSIATDFYDFRDKIRHGRKCCSPTFFSILISSPFKGAYPHKVIPFWVVLLQILLLIILLTVKLSGATFSWFGCLWPVITLAITTIVGLVKCNPKCWRRDHSYIERALGVPLMLSIILATIFACLQLDLTVCWSWHAVFVPVYVMILLCGVSLIVGFVRRDDNCLDSEEWIFIAYIAFAVMFMIPMTVFFPLLASTLNGTLDSRWVTIFTPIWVWDAIGVIVCVFADIYTI